ncbi:MAG: (Fe-S)-binding protein [Acidobacteria bacterium]|nr:(Fe-S)-binding protein [Acidobacteriota bacterium]
MKVSLFVTCLVDQFFPSVGTSAIRVLEKFGVHVDFDPRQTCCGQPASNSGYSDEARQVGAHYLEVFQDSEYVVVPSGSCCTMVRRYLPELFTEESPEARKARELAARTFELSEFLISVLKVSDTGARFPEIVTYHDSCHLLRELGIYEPPRRLIRSVRDIDFREMANSTRCCGFGGTFSVKFEDVSVALAEDKVRAIQDCGARFVVATDVSCLMHLDGLMRRNHIPVKTIHLAELLAKF